MGEKPKKQIVYVIGPYRSSDGEEGIKKNIAKAADIARELWEMGYAVICPHKNSGLIGGNVEDEDVIEAYLEILKNAQLAVTVEGWENVKVVK